MANRYWVGGTNTWNATATGKWSTTSGGAAGAAVPTAADDVFFNAASGAGTCTVGSAVSCRSINFTGYTGTFDFNGQPFSLGTSTAGGITLGSGGTYNNTGGATIALASTATGNIIRCNGKTIPCDMQDGTGSGSWTLQDNFSGGGFLSIGTAFNTANFAVNCSVIFMAAGTATLGSSVINLDTNINGGAGLIEGAGSTINVGTAQFTTSGSGTSLFAFSSTKTLVKVVSNSAVLALGDDGFFSGAPINSNFNITDFTVAAGTTIQGCENITIGISTVSMSGISGNLINIVSQLPGTFFSFSKATGTVVCDYLNMTDCHASGLAVFYAGANSVNGGNNTGWLFASPPPPGSVGTAVGTSTVTGVAKTRFRAVGSAVGTCSVTGVQRSRFRSVGQAIGTSSVTGVEKVRARYVGSASGTSIVHGVGSTGAHSEYLVGTASGTSVVTGVARTRYRVVGNAAGTSTVTGVGTMGLKVVGTSVGTSAVNGVGAVRYKTRGQALGTSSVTGVSNAKYRVVGNAAGTSSVTGVFTAGRKAIGTSIGTSIVTGVSRSSLRVVGNAAGSCSVNGISASRTRAVGNAVGSCSVHGVGVGQFRVIGTSIGNSVVTGVGKAALRLIGQAMGTSNVLGVSRSISRAMGQSIGQSIVLGVGSADFRGIGTAVGYSEVIGVGSRRIVPPVQTIVRLELVILNLNYTELFLNEGITTKLVIYPNQ